MALVAMVAPFFMIESAPHEVQNSQDGQVEVLKQQQQQSRVDQIITRQLRPLLANLTEKRNAIQQQRGFMTFAHSQPTDRPFFPALGHFCVIVIIA